MKSKFIREWRKVLSWKLIPELSREERIYVKQTGRLPSDKYDALGLNLNNWGRYVHPEYGECYVASDIFRYIIAMQDGDDVAQYSIDYKELVYQNINVFDFKKIIDYAWDQGADNLDESTTLQELLDQEEAVIIPLN